jgi:hypothetical protein
MDNIADFFIALNIYMLLVIRTQNFSDYTYYDIHWAFSVYNAKSGKDIDF